MNKIWFALLLMLSLSFAWQTDAPGTKVTFLNQTFYVSSIGGAISGTYSCETVPGSYVASGVGNITGCSGKQQTDGGELYFPIPDNETNITISGSTPDGSRSVVITTVTNQSCGTTIYYDAGRWVVVRKLNSTHVLYMGNSENITCPLNSDKLFRIRVGQTSPGPASITLTTYNSSIMTTDIPSMSSPNANVLPSGGYISKFGNSLVRSDFITLAAPRYINTSYCKLLLYFNNPYYGNIQLIPKYTFIPSTDIVVDFYNTSDHSSYVPNNTITYIYDSITSAWYIVPAYACSSYSIIGSSSTLQYNPTGETNGTMGEVPSQLSMAGSCSYNNVTRLLSCSATDGTATLTSITMVAYPLGNYSLVCNTTQAGSTASLSCTLPATTGVYNYVLFGKDANGYVYALSSNSINTAATEESDFGRNGWIALLMLFGVTGLLISSSLAVSMAFGVFALFAGMALHIIPVSGNVTIAILLAVVGFAIAYRLKI